MDAPRLTFALIALAVLVGLALLTWIAVRIEQGFRRPLQSAKPPEPCRRLHVADLPTDWARLRAQRRPPPFPVEDDPPFPPRS